MNREKRELPSLSFGRQLEPVVLVVSAHNGSNHNVFWVVRFKLLDAGAPVLSALLRDQLDVQVRGLSGSKQVSRGGSTNNAGRDVLNKVLVKGEGLGDSKTPSLVMRREGGLVQ